MLKKIIWSLTPTPITSTVRAFQDIRRQSPNPVLIYQMSKVGSSTVRACLHEAGVRNLHFHYMGEYWEKAASFYRSRNAILPYHFYLSRLVRPWLRLQSGPVRIITLVRDPVARKISNAFQLGRYTDLSGADAKAAGDWIRQNVDWNEPSPYESVWFDKEVYEIFGVDIYDHPFDRSNGYARIRTDEIDLLILRLEDLNTLIPSVVSDYVGRDLSLTRANTRSDPTYTTVKKSFKLPRNTLDNIYSQKMVRHCYSDHHVARFLRKWTETDGRPDTTDGEPPGHQMHHEKNGRETASRERPAHREM